MAKKLETALLVASLEKSAKKTGKALWADLAERVQGVRRNKVAVNLDKISEIASKNKGKMLIVPGKILAQGELNEKVTIVAISASEAAKAKIKAKGEYISLKKFSEGAEKLKVSNMIIVK